MMTDDMMYVGRSEGDYFEVFHYLADDQSKERDGSGNRPVLEILVCPENKIWIAGVNGLSIPQETNGRAHRHIDPQLEDAGIDTEHVCIASIIKYIVPRAATMMARVYCPVSTQHLLPPLPPKDIS
jgi:hypothetical protein